MPLKLIPPVAGKTPFYYVRGTHLGVAIFRSTKTGDRATAERFRKLWRDEIERGALAAPGEPTFFDAAVNYMAATGQTRFVGRLVDHFGKVPLREIGQQSIDEAAITLYPLAAPATRNRQVHTIMSAILKHAGKDAPLKRPKGSRGHQRTEWLTPEQAFRIFTAADAKDAEFGAFLRTLCYTGMRLSEALGLTTDRLAMAESFAYVPTTKNGEPRAVHLPPVVVAAMANLPRRVGRVFRFRKCGRFYTWLDEVLTAAGPDVAHVTFHTFRHTWATWMRRYAGLDTRGLVGTGAWRDRASASRYEHVVASEEAKRADLLPVEGSWTIRGLDAETSNSQGKSICG